MLGLFVVFAFILSTLADSSMADTTQFIPTDAGECQLMVYPQAKVIFYGQLEQLRLDSAIQILDVTIEFPEYDEFPVHSDKYHYKPHHWKKVYTNNAVQMMALLNTYKLFTMDLVSFSGATLNALLIDKPKFCFGNVSADVQDSMLVKTLLYDFDIYRNLTYNDLTSGDKVCHQKIYESPGLTANFEFECCSVQVNGTITCEIARSPKYYLWIRKVLPVVSVILVLVAPFVLSLFVTGSYIIKEYITDMPRLMSFRFTTEKQVPGPEWTLLRSEDDSSKKEDKKFPDANILVEQMRTENSALFDSTYIAKNKYLRIIVPHNKLLSPGDASSLMCYYLLRLLNPFRKYELKEEEDDDRAVTDDTAVKPVHPRIFTDLKTNKGAFWKLLFLILFEFLICLFPFWSALVLYYIYQKDEIQERETFANECGLHLDKPSICFRDPLRPIPVTAFTTGLFSFLGLFVIFAEFRNDFRVFLGHVFDEFRQIKFRKLINVAFDYFVLPFNLPFPMFPVVTIILVLPLWIFAVLLIVLNCIYYCIPMTFFMIRTFARAIQIFNGKGKIQISIEQKTTTMEQEDEKDQSQSALTTLIRAVVEVPRREKVVDKDFINLHPKRYQFQGNEYVPIWLTVFFMLWIVSHFYLWSCLLTSLLKVLLVKVAGLLYQIGEPLAGSDVIFYLIPIVLSRFLNLGHEYGECCQKVIETIKGKLSDDEACGRKSRTDMFYRNDASETGKLSRPPVAFKYFTDQEAVDICNEDHEEECLTRIFEATMQDCPPLQANHNPATKDGWDGLFERRTNCQAMICCKKKTEKSNDNQDVPPKQAKVATKYPLRTVFLEGAGGDVYNSVTTTARIYGNITERLCIGPVQGCENDKLLLRANGLVLFLDNDDGYTVRISSKFFHRFCQLKAPGCPGPIFDNLIKFLKDSLIILGILFVFVVVASILMKQHKVQGISSIIMTLLPFALPKLLYKDASLSVSEERDFKNLIEKHMKPFNQTWEITMIKMDFPETPAGWRSSSTNSGQRSDLSNGTGDRGDIGNNTLSNSSTHRTAAPLASEELMDVAESYPLMSIEANSNTTRSDKQNSLDTSPTYQRNVIVTAPKSMNTAEEKSTIEISWTRISDDLKTQQPTSVTLDTPRDTGKEKSYQRIYFLKKSNIPENLCCACSKNHFCCGEHRRRSLRPDPDFLVTI